MSVMRNVEQGCLLYLNIKALCTLINIQMHWSDYFTRFLVSYFKVSLVVKAIWRTHFFFLTLCSFWSHCLLQKCQLSVTILALSHCCTVPFKGFCIVLRCDAVFTDCSWKSSIAVLTVMKSSSKKMEAGHQWSPRKRCRRFLLRTTV